MHIKEINNRIKISNARIISPYRDIRKGCVLIENGKIIDVIAGDNISIDDCLEIDAGGRYLTPGFIDIHSHGGGGYDFMDGTAEAFEKAAEAHARHGTTSMMPTTVSCSNEELKCTIEAYEKADKLKRNGAQFLGLHLEGPYFSMVQKGGQDARYIRNPVPAEYNMILGWSDNIARWSAAPELDGAIEFGRHIKEKGILPSIGHSDAVYDDVLKAFEAGYTHITHLYSCVSGVRRINAYRHAGIIEAAFLMDDMTVEIIADGAHLPESLLKLIYKLKGPDRIALITDSMRAAGTAAEKSILGSLKDGQEVIIEDGVAKFADRTSFAGSIATTDRLVRTMVKIAGVPLHDAVKMASTTPAMIAGVANRKGIIAKGMDADIVLFDDDINIYMTIISGRIVHIST
jgi:N-acetylglucosamine-6-phosphate deacetylase